MCTIDDDCNRIIVFDIDLDRCCYYDGICYDNGSPQCIEKLSSALQLGYVFLAFLENAELSKFYIQINMFLPLKTRPILISIYLLKNPIYVVPAVLRACEEETI